MAYQKHSLFSRLSHEYFPAMQEYGYERKGDWSSSIFKGRKKRNIKTKKK